MVGDADETPDDPEKAAEEAIHDIWVFQYDQNGNQLIMPRYYEVTSTEIKKLNIRLAEGVDSHVYVLANTCDPEWAKGKDFSTIEKFVDYKYPFTEDKVPRLWRRGRRAGRQTNRGCRCPRCRRPGRWWRLRLWQ